ncbi:hypothetical protein CLOP_g23318, partial [Closterium sp. NIES-67]
QGAEVRGRSNGHLAKEGTLQSRREAAAVVRGKDVLQKLFYDLSERYKDRAGGLH